VSAAPQKGIFLKAKCVEIDTIDGLPFIQMMVNFNYKQAGTCIGCEGIGDFW
jgi:hypothetical protein